MSTVVNLGKMAGTKLDTLLVPVVNSTDAMDNGSFIVTTGAVAGDLNVKTCTAPVDVTKQEVLLVASPELVEINGYRIDVSDLSQFTNAKGKTARAYKIQVGDSVTIDDTGITGATVVGQYVVPVNGAYKPAVASDLTGGTLVAFQVDAKVTISTGNTRIAATKLIAVKSVA